MQKGERWAMSAWENSRNFATPPLVSPPEMTSEKRLQKCFTTQIWGLILIGRSVKEICFSQSEALPRSVISMGITAIVCQTSFRGKPDGEVPKWRLFVQTRAVHVIYLLSLKIFHLQFFAWLRNYFSFYVFFFFVIDRKQLKIAVCRIDSATQRRGSLNQQPLRFVVDTLKLNVR